MAYAIIRHAKLKTMGNVKASAEHTFRERDTPNADPSRTKNNQHIYAKNSDEVLEKLRARLPSKVRKNGVLCLEYLCTTSPEWWTEKHANPNAKNEFFLRSIKWLEERHGKENIVYVGTQMDETTPHLVAYVVPIDPKGKLNARHFTGGREKLSEYQDSYALALDGLGLDRGMKGSKAKHEQVKRHYGLVQASTDVPTLSTSDRLLMVMGKPTKNAQDALNAFEAGAVQGENFKTRQRAIKARKTALASKEKGLVEREAKTRSISTLHTEHTQITSSIQRQRNILNSLESDLEPTRRQLEHEKHKLQRSERAEQNALEALQNERQRVQNLERELWELKNPRAQTPASNQVDDPYSNRPEPPKFRR